MPVDYDKARSILEETFAGAEADLLQGKPQPPADADYQLWCDVLFRARSQSYREALLGCASAHIQDLSINIRLPYVDQGPDSISLRSFDEQVVNPFLHDKRIPCSKGPYLAMFRRGWQFTEGYRAAVRDPMANRAFLDCIGRLESLSTRPKLMAFLKYLLNRFCELRESATVALARIRRLTVRQYDALISGLLSVPSGGRLPVLLVLATLETLKGIFGLAWEIEHQGINVADVASGAGGDITVKCNGKTLMAVEITERIVDRARLVSTFNTKIAPAGIVDYLFFTKSANPDPEAAKLADQYFAQGHEINFLEIKNWILAILATIGASGRELFNANLLRQLDNQEMPKAIKVAWNEQISALVH